jgi:hypothetical protein
MNVGTMNELSRGSGIDTVVPASGESRERASVCPVSWGQTAATTERWAYSSFTYGETNYLLTVNINFPLSPP